MSLFQFSPDPPAHWEQHCAEHRALFHTSAWQRVIEAAFGSVSIYGWHAAARIGLAISVFRAGPFRIGYLGFPVGGVVSAVPSQSDTIDEWRSANFPVRLDCLRIPVSGFGPATELALPSAENPETAIQNLMGWDPHQIAKLRRDLNKARRSPIVVEHSFDPNLGQTLATLYRGTVTRHRGQLRYNEHYFRLLIELSRSHSRLRCFVARCDSDIAGFTVAALHGDTAYYLHGASSPRFKQYGASDLLLHEAIVWAKNRSAQCFNLMSSPPGQTTLIRYKEKWGGETRRHVTYTLPIRTWTYASFRVAESLNRMLHGALAGTKNLRDGR